MPVKLPTAGNRIKFSDLRTQFSKNLGAGDRLNFSDFYRKGDYVVQSGLNNSIPTSGTVKMTDFNGKGNPQTNNPIGWESIGAQGTWYDFTLPSASKRDADTQLFVTAGIFVNTNRTNGDFEIRRKSDGQVLTPTYSLKLSETWPVLQYSTVYFSSFVLAYNIGASTDDLEFRHTNSQNQSQLGCAVFTFYNNLQIASNSTLIDTQTFTDKNSEPTEERFDVTLDMEEGSWGGGVWSAWGISPGGSNPSNQFQQAFAVGGASNSVPVQSINTAFNRTTIERSYNPTVPGSGGLAMSTFCQNFGYDTRTIEVSRGKGPMIPVDNAQYGCSMLMGASFEA